MKAVVLTGIRQLENIEMRKPQITGAHDVLIKIAAVGICGSDVHYYSTGKIGSQVVKYPFRVGHEAAGTVAAVGGSVATVKAGDRIAIDPAVSCGVCDQCRNGRAHTCRELKFLGCPGQLEGCLAEYIIMPEKSCYRIPDQMTWAEAALVEPLSIGCYAVQQSIDLKHAKIGILGMGPIGFSVLQPALVQEAAAIYCTDRIKARCAKAVEHGASWAGNPDETDVVAAVMQREPQLLDAVFECCGQQEALDQALALLKPGGKLMLIGIPEFDRYTFSAEVARRHEICIQNVRRQNECVQASIDLVTDGKIEPGFMVTHHFELHDCRKAFDLVQNYADGVLKAIIDLA